MTSLSFARATALDLRHAYVDEEWVFAVNTLPDAAAYVGDAGAVESLYELLAPYDGLYGEAPVEGTFGAVSRGLGVLALTLGRVDDAVGHFEDAIQTERAMGARPWVALPAADGGSQRRDVELGVGDGLAVEVKSGLAEGDRVLEAGSTAR